MVDYSLKCVLSVIFENVCVRGITQILSDASVPTAMFQWNPSHIYHHTNSYIPPPFFHCSRCYWQSAPLHAVHTLNS